MNFLQDIQSQHFGLEEKDFCRFAELKHCWY